MTTVGFRFLAGIIGVVAAAGVFAWPHPAGPKDQDEMIRKGQFDGMWSGDKVKFSIEEVHEGGLFDGIAEFTDGDWKGVKFGVHLRFHGPSLIATRYVAGSAQVARAETPELIGGNYVWEGITMGIGLPKEGTTFKLSVPKQ